MPKSAVLISIVIIIVVGAGFLIYKPYLSTPVNPVACSMEAKLCPDGSSVGRSGPNCEFSACPNQIIYTNTKYGFNVSLPTSWTGYSIVNGTREIRNVSTGTVVATAPTVSVRHPLWTAQVPRQDIPIDIYTLAEWTGIIAGKYSVSAAPIPPSELARNSQYVFALPARYNYAFPAGFEEVQQIIASKSVSAFEPAIPPAPNTSQSGISGIVLLGPTCPVERVPPDPQCADRPFATKLVVTAVGSTKVIKEFSSDVNGKFSVDVSAGTYTIGPSASANMLPRCSITSPIQVTTGQYTSITISCDTGIR